MNARTNYRAPLACMVVVAVLSGCMSRATAQQPDPAAPQAGAVIVLEPGMGAVCEAAEGCVAMTRQAWMLMVLQVQMQATAEAVAIERANAEQSCKRESVRGRT